MTFTMNDMDFSVELKKRPKRTLKIADIDFDKLKLSFLLNYVTKNK